MKWLKAQYIVPVIVGLVLYSLLAPVVDPLLSGLLGGGNSNG